MIEVRKVTVNDRKIMEKGCDLCTNQKGLHEINFNDKDKKLHTNIALCQNCLKELNSRLDGLK